MLMLFFDNLLSPALWNYPNGGCKDHRNDDCWRVKISANESYNLNQKINCKFPWSINHLEKRLIGFIRPVKGTYINEISKKTIPKKNSATRAKK